MKQWDLVKITSPDETLVIVGICLGRCYQDDYSYRMMYEGKVADFDLRFWSIDVI